MKRGWLPDPVKSALVRSGRYIVLDDLLLTDHEWAGGITPESADMVKRRREVGVATGTVHVDHMPPIDKQRLELRAAAPIRAKVDQSDMADTPLFGQGSLL